jgi:hypothetical protein
MRRRIHSCHMRRIHAKSFSWSFTHKTAPRDNEEVPWAHRCTHLPVHPVAMAEVCVCVREGVLLTIKKVERILGDESAAPELAGIATV